MDCGTDPFLVKNLTNLNRITMRKTSKNRILGVFYFMLYPKMFLYELKKSFFNA